MDLKEALDKQNILLPENFFENIKKYKEHLQRWNKVHNLTGAKNEKTLNSFIYDSVFPVSFLKHHKMLLDVGTGAGFPGLILAMALPDTQVTLAEPLSKRASFLQFIKADLNLQNVTVVKKRVEELDAQIFDLITSRAVTDTKMLLELTKDFTSDTTTFLFYKGEKVFEELDAQNNRDLPHKVIQTTHIDNTQRHYLLLGENI